MEYEMEDEITAKLDDMVDAIKDKCDDTLTVKNYIKKVFDFCVDYCVYDTKNSDVIKTMINNKASKEDVLCQYKKYFNIDRAILSGFGVCQQFAFLFVILAGCSESGIRIPDDFNIVYNICKITMETGENDPHSIVIINYNHEKYYIDLSMAIKLKQYRYDFFMKSLSEYQNALKTHDKSSYNSEVSVSFNNGLSLKELYRTIKQQLYKENDGRCSVYKTDKNGDRIKP